MSKNLTAVQVEEIVDNALQALLWTSGEVTDENGESTLEMWDELYTYRDATPELRESITAEVVNLDNPDGDDATACEWRDALHMYLETNDADQFGHDMTLTRNHHGAGFWDRGLGELGSVLTEWAHSLGELESLFSGEDSIHPARWAGMFHAE